MENVLIDERRIHIDFSQSVAKLWNTHRRKTLKQAAEHILQNEQKQLDRELKVLNPFSTARRPSPRVLSKSQIDIGLDLGVQIEGTIETEREISDRKVGTEKGSDPVLMIAEIDADIKKRKEDDDDYIVANQ